MEYLEFLVIKRRIWIAVLLVSIVATWILVSPSLELFFGINMPFVTINHQEFTCFGYNIPNKMQLGFMMMSGMLLMLPARTIHLAIMKLEEVKAEKESVKKFQQDQDKFRLEFEQFQNEQQSMGPISFYDKNGNQIFL